tara:strand:+ start:653 stop:1261 length:609 start_codon:yes stop_codon:yes gene_type:complete
MALVGLALFALALTGCNRSGGGAGNGDGTEPVAVTPPGATTTAVRPSADTGSVPADTPSGPLPPLEREIEVTAFEPEVIGNVYASDFQDVILDRWDADGAAGRYALGQGRFEGTRQAGSDGPDGIDRIEGYWHQANSDQRCDTARDGTHYWGRFQMNVPRDRSGFIGFWSYCDGTPLDRWNGHLVRRDPEIAATVTRLLADR